MAFSIVFQGVQRFIACTRDVSKMKELRDTEGEELRVNQPTGEGMREREGERKPMNNNV